MDNFDAYFEQLQKDLDPFSPSERDDIVAEIQCHVEEGLHDTRMGLSEAERIKKLKSELGSPTRMAEGLYNAHWRNRWLEILLALVPLAVIFLAHLGVVVVLAYRDPTGIENQLCIAGLVIMPIYLGMIFIGRRRKSSMLTVWWLSWTIVYLSNTVFIAVGTESPVWMFVILGAALLFSLGLFGRKLWQSRKNGLLIAFATLPIMLWLAKWLLRIVYLMTNAPSFRLLYGERQWQISLIDIPFYIAIVVFIFLLSRQQRRWLSLIAGVVIYVLAATFIWQPLPLLYIAIYWLVLSVSIAIGLTLEYRRLCHNPLAST